MGSSDSSRNETVDVRGGTERELAGFVDQITRGSKNEGSTLRASELTPRESIISQGVEDTRLHLHSQFCPEIQSFH